jgi:hypothetical protein
MSKRGLAAFLWFLVGWSGAGMIGSFAGWPPMVAVIPGVVLGLLVHWDPTHVLWTRPQPKRRVMPINEFAAELDEQAAGSVVEQQTVR